MPEPLNDLMNFLSGAFRSEERIPSVPALAEACRPRISGNDRLSPAEQADIYRRQYWLRHVDALREDYAGLEHLIGEDAFEAFCRAYLTAHPSRSHTLRDLGEAIEAFSEGYEGFPAELRAIALEMIRYEHSLIDLFDGAEKAPLAASELLGLPPEAWETARLELNPLLVRMRLTYPVHRIKRSAGSPPGEVEMPALEPSPACVVLFRGRDLRSKYEELEPLAFDLLAAIAEGVPLVPACERIAAQASEAEAQELQAKIGAWFQLWAKAGWIVGVSTSSAAPEAIA